MTTTDIDLEQQVAQLLDARIGLKTDLSFRPRLTRVLRELIEAHAIDDERIVDVLKSDGSLLDELLDRVTVQETAFFRHPEQFEVIARDILPAVEGPLRAWSAASANGQEAYSLAMLFAECGRPGQVLASDVSAGALRRTAEARYAPREMSGVSAARRQRHFTGVGKDWQATTSLREMVSTQRHNLLDPIPRSVSGCQIVMCRNVLIYFSEAHARSFLKRLADVMDPTAILFVGGAETLWQTTDRFEATQIGTCYAYRPRPSGATRRSAPAPSTATRRATPPIRLLPQHPARVTVAPVPQAEPAPVSAREDMQRVGQQLMADGSVAEAVVAFRQWSYQCPDDPLAHFQMAIALERTADRITARRAYRAALAALDRCDADQLEHVLQGYGRTELRNLLVARSIGSDDPVDAPAVDEMTTTLTTRRPA